MKIPSGPSFPRKRESSPSVWFWTPAFAGVTAVFLISSAVAQGILPPRKDDSPPINSDKAPYILIDQKVPETVTVLDISGKTRTLLSFKAPTDILVVEFLSAHCPINQAAWKDLKRFYEDYQEWRVSFLAVSANSDETIDQVRQEMDKAGVTFPVVRDPDQEAAARLHAMATPEILIIDEYGVLRYRGALHDAMRGPQRGSKKWLARDALEAVIGHTDAVAVPEPDAFIGCAIH